MSKESWKFLEPVSFITIMASISYVFGWLYTQEYFSRIGIQYESLNLSTSFFLSKAVWPFIVMFFLFLVLYFIIIYKEIDLKENQNRYFSISTIMVLIIILFLLISSNMACYFGEQHGKRLVEGEKNDVFMINFSWKENPPKDIEGKELILIIHQDGKYYVVNKQKPAPEYPEVYIIPDDQIKFAIIKKSHFF
jgi:hypothetical protein